MKEKAPFILILIILIAINSFTLFLYHRLKQKEIEGEIIRVNQVSSLKDIQNTYRLNSKIDILNSCLCVDNVMIKDTVDNKFPINKIFDNLQERVLVCRFSQRHCESCVNSLIQILRNRVDSIGKENVVFLGNHRNNRIFKRTIPLYGIEDLKVYNCPKLSIPVEELGYPYYFILDSRLQISNVFVPDKATPNVTFEYLKNICKKF
ncbi:MAG: hypothetical protein COC06_09920 [Bacteroidales bacterium]|nr:MAG: hypothetical protein COC06_09920 [Bacteroidales bacterium]